MPLPVISEQDFEREVLKDLLRILSSKFLSGSVTPCKD